MKKIIFTIIFLVSSLVLVPSLSFAKTSCANFKNKHASINRIVAIVNDDVITLTELNAAIDLVTVQFKQTHTKLPAPDALKKQVLDQLINKQLQLQLAKQVNIQVSDAEIDKTIAQVAEQNNISVDELYGHLKSDGMSSVKYRQEMRDQMTIQKLQQVEVSHHITISPDEVRTFLNSRLYQVNVPQSYHVDEFLIPLADDPSAAQLAAGSSKAAELMKAAKNEDDFKSQMETYAKRFAAEYNDFGWHTAQDMPSAFVPYLGELEKNKMVGPIKTSNGLHILHLIKKRAVDSNQSKPSQKQAEDLLLQHKYMEAVQRWLSKLRSQAYINTNPC